MALDLKWHHKHWVDSTNYEYKVFKTDDATEITGIDAIFATGQILADTELTGLVAGIGQTIVVEGSDNNDGRYEVTAISLGTGPGAYVNEYDVTPTPDTLEEDTSGFTVRVEDSQRVDADQIPSQIKWGTENNDKYAAIQRSFCDLYFIADTGQQYADFFQSDVGSYFLEVYQNGGLYWVGVGITDQYLESLLAPPYVVRLTFSDGLQLLEGTRYFHPESDTRKTIIEVINHALQQTGLTLALSTAVNIYSETMWSGVIDNDSPLDEATVDPELWYQDPDHNFLEALIDICEIFGGRLFQWDGQWFIHRINEYSGDYLQRNWDTDGSFLNSEWVDTTVTVSQIKGDNGDMSLLPKANNVRVESGGSTQKNLLENGYFERWIAGLPVSWSKSGGTITVTQVEEGDTGRYSMQIANLTKSDGQYVQATFKDYYQSPSGPDDVVNTKKGTYQLSFRIKGEGLGGVANVYYSVKRGAYWLDSDGNWTNSAEQVINITTYDIDPFDFYGASASLDFTSHPESDAEDVVFKIHNSGTFDSVVFQFKPSGNEPVVPIEFERRPGIYGQKNAVGGGGDVSRAVTLTSIGNQHERLEGIPRDTVFDPDITWPDLNGRWKVRDSNVGGESVRTLGEVLADSIIDETASNQIRLNMTLVDVGHRMIWPLVIPSLDNKRFIANGVTFNPALNEWSGEWIEIISNPKYTELPTP